MKADSNCLLQILALSRVSVFKIPFPLSEVISNASFSRDLTNDQNFFAFSFFRGQSGSALSVSKEKIQLIRGDHGHSDKQMIANHCQKITPHIDSRSCTYYIT